MKTGIVLAATLALASIPIVAQMPAAENPQQSNPPAQPSSPPAAMPPGTQPDQPNSPPAATSGQQQPSTPANPAAAAESSATPATAAESSATPATAAAEAAPAAEMRPVKGELVSKLDTKTAKTGDDVVIETKASVKTADGTEIPKGSKLVGHVVAVKASTDGDNSQVALQFDHAELAGGQNLPIQTQIRSIGPTEGGAASSVEPSAASEPSMNRPSSGASGVPGGNPNSAAAVPGATPGADAAAASNGTPAAGTVVSRNGKIAIEATSIPGVLLANNEPGEQDPRMARASSILLGAKKDVQLDSGTPLELNVAAVAGGGQATK